jgi:hypothetical protein
LLGQKLYTVSVSISLRRIALSYSAYLF